MRLKQNIAVKLVAKNIWRSDLQTKNIVCKLQI